MSQLALFDRPPPEDPFAFLDAADPFAFLDGEKDPDGLRWYQREAVERIEAGWRDFQSQMIVVCTGGGKTQIFSTVAKHWDGQVLVLAHRDELVEQAMKRLEKATGEYVEIEKADMKASSRARIVVGSVQSFNQKRLDRMGKDRFSLVIADEFHHYVSPSYRRAIEYFNAKLLGVTATPDRADELALGQICENTAYLFDIEDGIDSGYLAPVRGKTVHLVDIDISKVDTNKSGDLVESQLDEVMQKSVHHMVYETLQREPNRQGIAFMPGVDSARYLAMAFNAKIPDCAAFVSGATPTLERRRIIKDFREGRYKYLCNCNVAVEGFDAPEAALLIQGRPTKSRALAAQMVGRVTRVLPGVVDDIHGRDAWRERQRAIAASRKPDCMILDFVGNAGRHTLVTPEDVLGGNYTPAEIEEAKKSTRERPGADVREALKAAREALRQVAERTRVNKVTSVVIDFNPFAVLRLDQTEEEKKMTSRFGAKPATDRQLDILRRKKVPEEFLDNLSSKDASKLIAEVFRRQDEGLATYAQLRRLQEYGIHDTDVAFDRASAAITYIQSKGWKKELVSAQTLNEIVYAPRAPGQEG